MALGPRISSDRPRRLEWILLDSHRRGRTTWAGHEDEHRHVHSTLRSATTHLHCERVATSPSRGIHMSCPTKRARTHTHRKSETSSCGQRGIALPEMTASADATYRIRTTQLPTIAQTALASAKCTLTTRPCPLRPSMIISETLCDQGRHRAHPVAHPSYVGRFHIRLACSCLPLHAPLPQLVGVTHTPLSSLDGPSVADSMVGSRHKD